MIMSHLNYKNLLNILLLSRFPFLLELVFLGWWNGFGDASLESPGLPVPRPVSRAFSSVINWLPSGKHNKYETAHMLALFISLWFLQWWNSPNVYAKNPTEKEDKIVAELLWHKFPICEVENQITFQVSICDDTVQCYENLHSKLNAV